MAIPKSHVVVISSPGMGHVTPCFELSKCLSSQHDVEVTFFVPSAQTTTTKQNQMLQSLTLPPNLHVISLPPVDISNDNDASAPLPTQLTTIVEKSLPAIQSIILESPRPPTVLIADLFSTSAFKMADRLQMDKYLYCTTSAKFYAYMAYTPKLINEIDIDGLNKSIDIPGCKSVRVEGLENCLTHRAAEKRQFILDQVSNYAKASGILVNTFQDLEPHTLQGLSDSNTLQEIPMPPIYPVGPLIKSDMEPSFQKSDCQAWLDKQPRGSVIFISLGSAGTLSAEQIIELAWGLELSKQRFLWVIRPPQEFDAAAYLAAGVGHNEPATYLPDGFLARTHGIGYIVPNWAPQVDILSHKSIGAFISHCGWNSTLESIFYGVPLLSWPLYAEQNWNARQLTEDVEVVVPLGNISGKGVVGREKIRNTLMMVMVEKNGELGKRADELRHGAIGATSKGGSSYESLSKLVRSWSLDETTE